MLYCMIIKLLKKKTNMYLRWHFQLVICKLYLLIWFEPNSLRRVTKLVLLFPVTFPTHCFTFIFSICIKSAFIRYHFEIFHSIAWDGTWSGCWKTKDVWKWCGRVLLLVGVLGLVTHLMNKKLQAVLLRYHVSIRKIFCWKTSLLYNDLEWQQFCYRNFSSI